MDKITLKGMRIFGYHGVYPWEKEQGRYFEIDAELFLSLDKAAGGDDLSRSVDYAEVFGLIKAQFTGQVFDLIETAAARLCDAVLSQFPVERVLIRVRKPAPPVDGQIDYAEVEVERSRR